MTTFEEYLRAKEAIKTFYDAGMPDTDSDAYYGFKAEYEALHSIIREYEEEQKMDNPIQVNLKVNSTSSTQIKWKEVYVEAKKSANFQTYTVGGLIEIPDNVAVPDFIIREAQAKCRALTQEQINIDKKVKQ